MPVKVQRHRASPSAITKNRVVFFGSRGWSDTARIVNALSALDPKANIIVTGGAGGADALANKEAIARGFETEVYPADWDRYGRSAGFIRNEHMISLPRVHMAMGFWNGRSPGSKHTIDLALKYKVNLAVFFPLPKSTS